MVVCTLIVCVDNRKLYDTIITTYMININQVEIIFHGLMGSYTSPCFFRFNLKTKHVDFIHSFACQCHDTLKRMREQTDRQFLTEKVFEDFTLF